MQDDFRNTFTITLSVDPPLASTKERAVITRKFEADYDHGLGAALRAKEDVPDEAEKLAKNFLESEPLRRQFEHSRRLDEKTEKQRNELRKAIEGRLTYEIAQWMVENYVDDMIDDYFEQRDE